MQYDLTELAWRTSSYSSGNGQCVEVADVRGAVPVRDSKAASGPVLIFGAGAWAAFVAGMRESGIAATV